MNAEVKECNKTRFDNAVVEAAKRVDLIEIMKADGLNVKCNGNNNSARVCSGKSFLYIMTRSKTDPLVWLYLDNGKTKNAINYIQETRTYSFPQAVRYLNSDAPKIETIKGSDNPHNVKTTIQLHQKNQTEIAAPFEKKIITFTQKSTAEQNKSGCEYCKKRGISDETIDKALSAGWVEYGVSNYEHDIKANRAGVRFISRDRDGYIRCVETRYLEPIVLKNGNAIKTMAERGIDKNFALVVPGSNDNVHIVEGGFDALALIDLCKRHKIDQPTILVTFGINSGFLKNDEIKPLLLDAKKIMIWSETESADTEEKRIEKQSKTDRAHEIQKEKLIEGGITAEISIRPPQGGFKDLADKNLHEVQTLEKQVSMSKKQDIEIEFN